MDLVLILGQAETGIVAVTVGGDGHTIADRRKYPLEGILVYPSLGIAVIEAFWAAYHSSLQDKKVAQLLADP